MSSLFVLLLLAAAVSPGHAAASAVIASTCAAAANSSARTSYDFCVGALSADPTAASAADARGVAVAAANLTAANATSTVRVLADLIGSLKECLRLYKEMRGLVAGGMKDLRAGRLSAAWPTLRNASFHPAFCELALLEGNSTPKDPVSDENTASSGLSAMAADIAEALSEHRTAPPNFNN